MKAKILLVEDDERLGQQVVQTLTGAGHRVTWLKDGDAALGADPSQQDLVILDLMLPGAYGMDVLKAYRKQGDVPVLILSARQATPDKVRALELGADDFLTKPFWPEELLARIDARLRRPALQREGRLAIGKLGIDFEARTVLAEGHPVTLTKVEFDLLAALAKHGGAAVTRAWLAEHVLDPERDGTERTLDVHVSRLRKKLGSCGGQVATVWGIGYRLEANGRA
jgi:two-component system response regulator MtrA